MSTEGFPLTVNSDHGLMFAINVVTDLYRKHGHITISDVRIGADRSIDQNSLLHVWLTECAAFYLSKHKKDVTPTDLEGMKRAAKARFYVEHKQPWMVHEISNPWTNAKKKDYTSSKSWKRGEMTMFLDWLQNVAATDGILLEAIGEYAKIKRDQSK
jgi:hypothetical protein